jgi:hypothetical protein
VSKVSPAMQIFTLGGSWSGGQGNKYGEVFDPLAAAWRGLTTVKPEFILTADKAGTYRADNHAWFFGWLNGEGELPPLFCMVGCFAKFVGV